MPCTNFELVKWRYFSQAAIRNFEINRINRRRDERQRQKSSTNLPVAMSRDLRSCTKRVLVGGPLAILECHIRHKHQIDWGFPILICRNRCESPFSAELLRRLAPLILLPQSWCHGLWLTFGSRSCHRSLRRWYGRRIKHLLFIFLALQPFVWYIFGEPRSSTKLTSHSLSSCYCNSGWHSLLTCLGTWYSEIQFCNFFDGLPFVIFFRRDHTRVFWMTSTVKSSNHNPSPFETATI